MSNVKVKDVVKPYSGDDDIEAWLIKVELVARLTKVKNQAEFIPLFLEGPALAVYLQMNEEDLKSPEKIKQRLKEAFGEDPFVAYQKLVNARWDGEPIDVYATELGRLARSAGIEGETILKRAFVVGLPSEVGRDLRALKDIEAMSMPDLISRARAISAAVRETDLVAIARDTQGKRVGHERDRRGVNRDMRGVRCFECKRLGHMARNCYEKPEKHGKELDVNRDMRGIRCFECKKLGHVASDCHEKPEKQGNEFDGPVGPATDPSNH